MEFFTHAALLASGAVVIVQEVLKVFPESFAAKYPVLTNIVLSVIASLIAVWQDLLKQPQAWTDWLLLVGTVSVVAAFVYNTLVKNREFLRTPAGGSGANRSLRG